MLKKSTFLSLAGILCVAGPVHAANLDDLYAPLLDQGRYVNSLQSSYYRMKEHGQHGSASFGAFDANPDYWRVTNALRYAPTPGLDITFGFGERFSNEYTRLTYNPSQVLAFNNQYDIDQFHEFSFDVRKRTGRAELFLKTQANRHRASWRSAPGFADFNFFTDIRSHFEDIQGGFRYVSENRERGDQSNLSKLRRPLLQAGQINIEGEVGYRNGRLRRTNTFYGTSPATLRNYFHELRFHLIPAVKIRYGWSDRLEVGSGIEYTTPHKYQYEFQQSNPDSTTKYLTAAYHLTRNIKVPLGMSYRPTENLGVQFTSDIRYAEQRMDHWIKEFDDTLTSFPAQKLGYINTRPTLTLHYLIDRDKPVTKDEFVSVSKPLLSQDQVFLEFRITKDVTSLKGKSPQGTQNLIDPENLFLFPVDNFVSGTEYASRLVGNATNAAANVLAQNTLKLESSASYGLSDTMNVGLGIGYTFEHTAHQFIFQEPTDPANAFFKTEPYFYFDLNYDWRLTQNNMLSLNAHIVPRYKTFVETDAHPTVFEARTRYFEVTAAWKSYF